MVTPLRLLAVDPGVTTGWSLWMVWPDAPLERVDCGIIRGGLKGWLGFAETRIAGMRPDVTVVEQFGYGGDPIFDMTMQGKLIEGAIVAVWRALGLEPPIWQRRTDKRAVPDRVLKRVGLWVDNAEARDRWHHEDARDLNDSQIHALVWAKYEQHRPTTEWLWPDVD